MVLEEDNSLRGYNYDDWTFIKESPLSHIHGIHSYPARMHPPVARKLIKLYATEGNLVLDPFCGSGGVLSEALIQSCDCVGIDINPLACLISRVKTTLIDPHTLNVKAKELLNDVKETLSSPKLQLIKRSTKQASENENESNILEMVHQFENVEIKLPKLEEGNLFFWFKPNSVVELAVIKHCIDKVPDEKIREFFYACFSNTVRDVSGTRNGEFKLYRIAPEKWTVYNPDTVGTFSKKIVANITNMNEYRSLFKEHHRIGHALIINSDSRRIFSDFSPEQQKTLYENEPAGIKGKVNLIVTSPPYGDSGTTVAYGQYSRYSSFWLGYEKSTYFHVDKKSLGGKISDNQLNSPTLDRVLKDISSVDDDRAKVVKSFYVDFNDCLKNFYKIMADNGKACFVVGNRTVKNVKIPTDNIIIELGEALKLNKLTTFSRSIPNKRMPLRNSPTNVKGQNCNTMDAETIVVLEKS